MKTILILGAGLSASSMIRYLLNASEKEGWQLRIVDRELSRVEMLIKGFSSVDLNEKIESVRLQTLYYASSTFHVDIAKDCISLRKNLTYYPMK